LSPVIDPTEPRVRRCVVRVDRERLHRRLAGLGVALLVGQQALIRLVVEILCLRDPRWGIARIDRQHLAIERVGLLERLGGARPSELLCLQVHCVSLGIGRARFRRRTEQSDPELLHYVRRDLVLDREDVVELAVVGLRPQVRVGPGADQLRRDTHRVAGLAHRAFEHIGNVQRARDLRDAGLLALERERRRARRHLQLRNLREQVQQLFGDAVGKILVRLFIAHVDERQHRDRVFGDRHIVGVASQPAALVPDERVRQQQHNGKREYADDPAIEFLAGVRSDRIGWIDLALALEALRCELVKPRERNPEWKPDDGRDEKPACRPFRRAD
jgi:hypothetical protein